MENLVSEGLPLALFGVGVVFFFLCLLIAATSAMSVLVNRFTRAPGRTFSRQDDAFMSPAQMAAVIAAVTMHRTRRRTRQGSP